MSNDITPARGQVPAVQTDSLVVKIIELASTPGLNPEMYDRLVAWQEREEARQAEERFNAVMNLAQQEIQPVARSAENKQTNSFYAKLEDVDEAIRPIYLRHGFAVSYNTVPPLVPGNIRVECEVALGRHSKKYYREAPADTLGPKGSAVKTVLHGGGSTETYLKRYAVCGAFNVVFASLDDDGQRGGMRYITSAKVETIEIKLKETNADRARFLEYFNVLDVHLMQDDQFVPAMNMLNAKRVAAPKPPADDFPGDRP